MRHALAFMTSAYSSFSGCRQYRENVAAAQAAIGEGAPQVDKLRVFYNHPHFVEPSAERLKEALSRFGERDKVYVLFTAHSIPISMAESSDYVKQLEETARLVAEASAVKHWKLVYQSRSGSPSQPWLEPDILEYSGKNKRPGHSQRSRCPYWLHLRPHGDYLRSGYRGERSCD